MMTNEELAKLWNVSLDEVKRISDYMNKNYYLCVGKSRKDGLFYGLMYRMDEKHGPMLALSLSQGYETPQKAADVFNKVFDKIEMPELRAKLMGVPVDAYKTLKKIEIAPATTQNKNYNFCLDRGSRD